MATHLPVTDHKGTIVVEPGQVLPRCIGDHELISVIGRGSYGEVWLARNILGTYRAIKMVRQQNFRSHRPFEREFEGIQRFEPISRTHPGFVSILHVGQSADAACFYYMMELADDCCTGQQCSPDSYRPRTLASELAKPGRLPPAQCITIGLVLTSALAHLHRYGLVHRDVKPSNIIFVQEEPKFADIGLVTTIGEAATFVGTEGYFPPEGPGKPGADLFSLGKVLYQIITGKEVSDFPALPTALRDMADAPQILRINDIILKACHPDPRKRFTSADEMNRALQRIHDKSPTVMQATIAEPESKSLAVLPFVNLNADSENDFLSDGITEDLINALTHVKGLRVAGRTSAFAFKGKSQDLRKIAEQLGVEGIVEGSVRKAGNRLRITAQLINAGDGCHLWSERYDRQMEDVFTLQDEISRAIVEALKVRWVDSIQDQITKRHTASTEAYQLYLKGRFFWSQRGEQLQKALCYFQLAALEDPKYALAYSGVADSFNLLGFYGHLRPKEAFPKAKAAALKALELDESLAEPHNSLGFNLLIHEWDWPSAEKEFLRALQLNPNYVPARYWRASYLSAAGRHDEAISEVSEALRIDPLSIFVNTHLGWTFFHARKYTSAEAQIRKALELEPKFLLAHWLLGRICSARRAYAQAIAEFKKGIEISPSSTWGLAWLGHTYAVSGQRDEALKILSILEQRSQQEYVRAYLLAMVHVGLGHTDKAFNWLERAYEDRDVWMGWLNCDPIYDCLHDDPRFVNLFARIGLDLDAPIQT